MLHGGHPVDAEICCFHQFYKVAVTNWDLYLAADWTSASLHLHAVYLRSVHMRTLHARTCPHACAHTLRKTHCGKSAPKAAFAFNKKLCANVCVSGPLPGSQCVGAKRRCTHNRGRCCRINARSGRLGRVTGQSRAHAWPEARHGTYMARTRYGRC